MLNCCKLDLTCRGKKPTMVSVCRRVKLTLTVLMGLTFYIAVKLLSNGSEVSNDKELNADKQHVQHQFQCRIPDENLRNLSDELREMSQDEFKKRLDEALSQAQNHKPIRIVHVEAEYHKTGRSHKTPQCCGNCEITYDISKIDDPNTKAVVVHFSRATKRYFMEHFRNRRADQYFVWQCREAPLMFQYRHMTFTGIDSDFNLSMTYRGNSDIWFPSGWEDSIDDLNLPLTDDKFNELVEGKNRLALWVVSNCGGRSGAEKRMKYVKDLLKHNLDIDLGGRCFKDRSENFNNEKYKFYFAFENSWNCSDYITEKFWRNALSYGTVPVVLGAVKGDYLKIAPHNSFIYAHDFKSPKEIAEYLKYLDRNQTAYVEYLNWMKQPKRASPMANRERGMCQLCRVLHGINVDNLYNPNYMSRYRDIPMFGHPARPRVVPSISDWYLGEDNKGCLDDV